MRELDQRLLSRTLSIVRRSMPSCNWDQYAEAIAADRYALEQHLRKPDWTSIAAPCGETERLDIRMSSGAGWDG